MKFKVGDQVRLTREAILSKVRCNFIIEEELIDGAEVIYVKDRRVCYQDMKLKKQLIHKNELELVPEEPEFECGEEIEVFTYNDKLWKKAIFITKIPGNVGCAYACVHGNNIDEYKKGHSFEVELWRTVRKLRPQLTRKEIAEKFGVSEDFTLVDE